MADTLPNIEITRGGEWVDLYAESGIAVGTRIIVQSLSGGSVRLSTKATAPSSDDGYQLLREGEEGSNQSGDSGAWASSISGGVVNVRAYV